MSVIDVTDLRKAYGGRTAVDGVSFSVDEGEIFGILGPNGAGKTTTVECVEGLRVPDAGRVRVAGLDPVADHAEVTRVLGAQLQQSELQLKLTVREALELYASFHPRPADWRPLAERLGLTAKLTTRFAKLSGGQKQRLFIALALIGNPRIVVLDELTTGLDPRARRDTWELIEDVRAGGVTVPSSPTSRRRPSASATASPSSTRDASPPSTPRRDSSAARPGPPSSASPRPPRSTTPTSTRCPGSPRPPARTAGSPCPAPTTP
jgi:ABC-type multidrug transport system ATPase subunit